MSANFYLGDIPIIPINEFHCRNETPTPIKMAIISPLLNVL